MNNYSEQINIFIINSKKLLSKNLQKIMHDNTITIDDIYPISTEGNPNHSLPDKLYATELFNSLGYLYEKTLPKELRKDFGQFYTNDCSLIDTMVSDSKLFKGKILEPSCGSGLFLVQIINKIIQELQQKKYNSEYILNYIQETIYGNDVDTFAIKIAEINIIATLLPLIAVAKLNNPQFKLKKLHLSTYDFTKKNIFNNKFSLVIGNPPFVTMYGKRSRNMTEEKRAYFNTFDFVQNKTGNNKFNLSMFFVENGLKALTTNGQLIFILDIAFFETAYIDLRKYIIQKYHINCITKGLQAFNDVASGQIILNISNSPYPNNNVIFNDYHNNTSTSVNQTLWNNSKNKYKIYIPLSPQEDLINNKILKYPKLDTYFPGKALRTCCALTGKTEEFIVDPNVEKENLVFPYIEGSKGLKNKFGELHPLRHIKYDYKLQLAISEQFKQELSLAGVKNKKRVTLGDKEAYLSPKIFIRQSASQIIATYTEAPYAANNSIYILSNKSNSKNETDLLKYVCGILNSDLITYFCRINKIIRIEKGKTPQIKTSDLKDIRICISKEYYYSIIDTVNKLLISPNNVNLLSELNKQIYNIYNINKTEQLFIQSYLYA